MRIAEIDQRPFSFEVGVGHRLAVLVDQLKRPADRTGERRSGHTPRVIPQGQGEEGAGPEDDEPGENGGDQQEAA